MIAICAIGTLRRLAGAIASLAAPKTVIVAKNTSGQKLEPGQLVYYDAATAAVKLAEYEKHRDSASPTPNSQLPAPKPPTPHGVVNSFAVPSWRFRSPSTSLPIVTPCGRECMVAVVILSRLVAPRRTMIWCALPCTLRQARDHSGHAYNCGLLSIHELCAVHTSLRKLEAMPRRPDCPGTGKGGGP